MTKWGGKKYGGTLHSVLVQTMRHAESLTFLLEKREKYPYAARASISLNPVECDRMTGIYSASAVIETGYRVWIFKTTADRANAILAFPVLKVIDFPEILP